MEACAPSTCPAGVVSIGAGAFGGCYNLTDIVVAPENPAYTSLDGVLFEKDQSVLVQCPAGRTGDFVIPDTVTHIGAAAFLACDKLTSIVIPEGVTYIGDYAFDQCRSLAKLTLPSSVRHLGDGALRYCSALTDLVIPENTVGSLNNDLLLGCDALRNLTLPAGVTDISGTAFREVRTLRSITVAPDNPAYRSLDGVLFNKNLTVLVHYPKGRIGSFAIPHGVAASPASESLTSRTSRSKARRSSDSPRERPGATPFRPTSPPSPSGPSRTASGSRT